IDTRAPNRYQGGVLLERWCASHCMSHEGLKARVPAALKRHALGLALGFALAAAIANPALAAAAKSKHPGRHDVRVTVERMRILMGTPCTIVAEGLDSVWTAASIDSALHLIAALDGVLSLWKDGGELSALDSAEAEVRTQVSPSLYAVIDSALAIAAETDGAFDPTVEPLTRVWDLRGEGRVPAPEQIADARQSVGWAMVQIEPTIRTVRFRREHMGLDLDGIAKGYALDVAIAFLRTRRLSRVLIDFGSDFECFSDGEAWTLDVGDPDDRNAPVVRLVTRSGGVSISGQSARFLTKNGGHFDRVLDPRSGRPLDLRASVTVVARTGTRSDALATAFLVMGRERIPEFLASHRDLGVMWLEREGHSLKGWRWNLPTASIAPNVKLDWVQ
ncbi:MAG: FAD:protein FMN transferase, partial [Candidatus Eiseniibacteriota bacterium]